MQTERNKLSKPSSTTRSLDTRSTSCDKDDQGGRRLQFVGVSSFDSRLPHLKAAFSGKRIRREDPLDFVDPHPIETVIEEEENEVDLY
jgi:hypothetical protein